MRSRTLVALVATLVLGVLTFASASFAQYDKDEKKPAGDDKSGMHMGDKKMSPEEMKEMQAWIKYATPGPEHKRLAEFVGTWDAQVKHWHDASAPPEQSSGVMVNEMCLGDRFLKHNFKGTAMGMPFEGGGVWGYDNALKKYVGVWADTMGTGLMTSHGTFDDAKKTFTSTGEMPNPTEEGKMMKMREVVTIHDNDHHTMEMYMPGKDGKEMRCMEIMYTRRK